MRIGSRRFTPTVFATLLTLAGIAAFTWLGFWQLGRAAEKRELIARYEEGAHTTADLDAANVATLAQYQHVRLRGRYDGEHQILLDNMPSQHGRPGYRVVTPIELSSGGWMLVDRGWREPGATRSEIPDVSVDTAERTIAGRVDSLPRAGMVLGEGSIDASAPWPRVMNFPTAQAAQQALNRPLLPGLVLLDPDQPDGYERSTEVRLPFGAERHVAYAVQWFAFAAAALVIYVILSLRRKDDDRVQGS